MNHRQLFVANVQYKKPTAAGMTEAKGLLRYFTYRDSRYDRQVQPAGRERWTSRGLGNSLKAIAQRCEELKSDHVLLFNLVLNPNPELMQFSPPGQAADLGA